MGYDTMHRSGPEVVRVTITLNQKVYEEIKRMSKSVGLRPSTWITMICTSKANNISFSFSDDVDRD